MNLPRRSSHAALALLAASALFSVFGQAAASPTPTLDPATLTAPLTAVASPTVILTETEVPASPSATVTPGVTAGTSTPTPTPTATPPPTATPAPTPTPHRTAVARSPVDQVRQVLPQVVRPARHRSTAQHIQDWLTLLNFL